jgi:plasmid stabilization system protein ParE
MSSEIRFAPEVAIDIHEAYAWYQQARDGLGNDFIASLEVCCQQIAQAPTLLAKMHGEFRRAMVRRFPYAVFYLVEGDDVVVYGVFHASRDPDLVRRRLGRKPT